jgi:hypothetical protein
MKLSYPQEYLFKVSEGTTTWEYFVRFRDSHGKTSEVPMKYSPSQSLVTFNFPSFGKELGYTMTIVKRSVTSGVDQNLHRKEVTLTSDINNEVRTASNLLQGTITQNIEKELYRSGFRTSLYSTFGEKWNALGTGRDAFDVARGNVTVIGKHLAATELFDEAELAGKGDMLPLVQLAASPNVPWFQSILSPLMYDLYPYDNATKIKWRDPTLVGVKPLKGVTLANSIGLYKLSDENFTSGVFQQKSGTAIIGYYVSYYTFWDYSDLSNQVAAKYFDNWHSRPEGVRRLMSSAGYTDMVEGTYPVDIRYVLPGETQPAFSSQVTIKY